MKMKNVVIFGILSFLLILSGCLSNTQPQSQEKTGEMIKQTASTYQNISKRAASNGVQNGVYLLINGTYQYYTFETLFLMNTSNFNGFLSNLGATYSEATPSSYVVVNDTAVSIKNYVLGGGSASLEGSNAVATSSLTVITPTTPVVPISSKGIAGDLITTLGGTLTIGNISITKQPTKTTYYVGDALDLSGLEVSGTYTGNITRVISITSGAVTGFDSSTAGSITVTVTYKGKTATFNVSVIALASISVSTPPTKTTYNIGDALDITGIVVTATFTDSSNKTITVTSGAISGFVSTTAGTITLTITYGGKTTTMQVIISPAATLSSINVTTPPTKTSYSTGEALDISGLVVTATYSDSSTKTVVITSGAITGFESTAAGTKTLTISYGGKTTTFQVVIGGSTTVTSNAAIQDIAISTTTRKAIIVINSSGTSTNPEESVGSLPVSITINTPSSKISANSKSYIKDLSNPQPISFAQKRGYQTSAKITASDTKYTFKVGNNTLVANKVYGTSDSAVKCLIYLQDGLNLTTDWNKVGTYFDTNIYPVVSTSYGEPTDIDGNGKIVILYYDMGVAEMNTMGYFTAADLIAGSGNDTEIFYMNIKWGVSAADRLSNPATAADPLDPEMVRTLSHEFQHMINYGYRVITKKLPEMDSWMNEGLSEASEQIVSKTVGSGRITTFKNDLLGKLRNGKSLCVWGNDDESYALSYTFMTYIKNQSALKERLFKTIIDSNYGDYRSIEDAMKLENSFFTNFEQVMLGYRVANLVNGDGVYGYGSEKTSFDFSSFARATDSKFTQKLLPGAAVYVFPSQTDLTNFNPTGQGTNIKFLRINK